MSPTPSRRRLLAATTVMLVAAILVAVGVGGLVRGHQHEPTLTPSPTIAPTAAGGTDRDRVVRVDPSEDGARFARSVAAVLFDWDTTTTTRPAQIIDALVAVGDPSGQDVPGLAADAAGYLPTADQWTQLGEYATRQHLEVTDAAVPDSWAPILADPGHGLVDGTIAVTIDGVRVREGAWFGQTTTSRSTVAFTVFALCPPATDDECRLLRLSGLDTPLR